ncbi:thioredoxin fold domain-containing protein [Shewanella electrodiphila]|uniref:Thioredoxin fold domain-containing protein n=1 Tax=Shewanella electrodiphila TaxID=934143 RepID=A0ABT0KRR4_9GAMM|nr:thioredoxin fold domain-containing protein [Shewanella electrodiphila]MCL1046448.1 thioredoxin fold domain-containing protein [Shewanella electrodiphila]
MVENSMLALKASFNCLVLLTALAVGSTASADHTNTALSVAQIQLKDLRTSQSSVSYHAEKPTVLMYFQPDCSWCKKQGKIITELLGECGNSVHFTLVGDKGSKSQLKRELRHFSADIPSKQSNKMFVRKSGGVKGFPTTLVLDTQGHVLAKRRGFTSETMLRRLTNELSQGECAL